MKNLFLALGFLLSLTSQADVKITQLPLGTASSTDATDVFPYVDVSSGVTKKMTLWDLINLPPLASTYVTASSTTTFTNKSISGSTNTLTNIPRASIAAGTANQVLYNNGSGNLTGSSDLIFSGGSLGVGTSPGALGEIFLVSSASSNAARFSTNSSSGSIGGNIAINLHNVNSTVGNISEIVGYNSQSAPFAELGFVAVDQDPAGTQTGKIIFGVTNNGALTTKLTLKQNGNLNLTNFSTAGVVSNGSNGDLASTATLSTTLGGTGLNNSAATGLQKYAAGTGSVATLVNADVSASAAIDFSKLGALSSGNILVGSVGNVATSTAVTGDITISNAGVTAIGASKVTNAMLNTAVSAAKGGFGSDVSGSSGVPLFSTGTPTFTSTSGTGNFLRASSPTTSGTFNADAISANGNITFTSPSTQGIVGTTTNNNAAAGNVGQYTTINSGGVTVATCGSPDLVATLPLPTGGDYDVEATVLLGFSATTATGWTCGLSTLNNSIDSFGSGGFNKLLVPVAFGGNDDFGIPLGRRRFSVAAASNVYLVCTLTCTVKGGAAWSSNSFVSARRMR